MKPFDLEAAQRGEPVQLLDDNQWRDTHFVGISKLGHVVAQGNFRCGEFSTWSHDKVRMAPKKRTVFLNVYAHRLEARPGNQAATFDTASDAADNAARNGVGLLKIAMPIEIEE
jgi:hypothetical protein